MKITSSVYKNNLDLSENIPLETPYVVYVEPSGFCNFKCVFCHQYENSHKMKKDFMSVKTFDKLLFDLQNFKDKIKMVRICGQGEPLMNKKLGVMLEKLYKSQCAEKIEIVSNGSLFNKKNIENISKYATRIIISLESLNDDGYKKICNTNIKFETILKNIKMMFLNKRDCIVHVKIPSTSIKSDLERNVFFSIFKEISDESNVEHIVPLWPSVDISSKIVETNKSRWDAKYTKKEVCVQIFKGLQVCANGDVVPCCVDWKRVNLLENINFVSLQEIWKGDKIKQLQNNHLKGIKNKILPCSNCFMNDYSERDNLDHLLNNLEIK